MSSKPSKDQIAAYEAITKQKETYGKFHKTCFHIHTPESYDYCFLAEWKDTEKYKKSSEDDILQICIDEKVIPKTFSLEDIVLEGDYACYSSKKELLSFIMLADVIVKNEIEIVVVSDHHTIAGVNKLRVAIKEICKSKKHTVYPEVLCGIEISCADKNHVVGIFDDRDKSTVAQIKKWLSEKLLSIEEGSFETSLEVLSFINSINGIGYIAHINTSDIFKKEKYLSGAYKTKLFSDKVLNIIGLSNIETYDLIKDKIKSYRSSDIQVVLDNDSHSIDTINNSLFWIKGNKRNFSMLKEAFEDYDISIKFDIENLQKQYIKGLYIENREGGFLCSKQSKAFCVTFSRALNCIIGGRGTGKSTVLEMLEYVLSQRCSSEGLLEYLCAHGNTWILYEHYGTEYLIEMRMPVKKEKYDNILRYFGQNPYGYYHFRYTYDENKIGDYAYQNYLRMYKIVDTGKSWNLEPVYNKNDLLKKFFDVRYSVNDLVNTASTNRINSFILNTMFKNNILGNPEQSIRFKKKSGLCKALSDTKDLLCKRREKVESVINPFNESQKDILRIVYSQDIPVKEPPIEEWLFKKSIKMNYWYSNYNITNENVVQYLLTLCDRVGIFSFLSMTVNKDVRSVLDIISPLTFSSDLTPAMVTQGIKTLNPENVVSFLEKVLGNLITDDNVQQIVNYLKFYIRESEQFSLEFNINNKEGGVTKRNFKRVDSLSLGQKVVAMLNFILSYSEYSNDYRPLIIDQPEDNLDNQYIYKNLVKQLRNIKDKRQVIIATHNATIVTNAKADQVCTMVSDNSNGWVDISGYPGEIAIKKRIINHLEGGSNSFIHKMIIYKDALQFKNNQLK